GKVADVSPHVDVERTLAILLDELHGIVEDVRVSSARVLLLPDVAVAVGGVDRVDSVGARRLLRPDVPFAEVPGGVALFLQEFGDRDSLAETTPGGVLAECGGELPGHQTGAAGTARHTGH